MNKAIKDFFRFEHGYFRLSGNPVRYFIRQNNIVAHIVDRIKFRLFPKLFIITSFPTHIDVEVSSLCQLRCPMCYSTYLDGSFKGIMKYELFTKIIDQAVLGGAYSVKLSWRGEPLLNPRIVDMVCYAKKSGMKEVAFLSNGERLDHQIAEELTDAGLDWISFSVDGLDEVYNRIRMPAVLDDIKEKISHLRRYRDKNRKKKPLIRVQSLLSAIKDNATVYKTTWDGIADQINFISDEARDFEIKDMAHDPHYTCPTPWQRMSIAFDGKVHQCIADYSRRWVMGDVNSQSLRDIWKSENFTRLRNYFRSHTALQNCGACLYCTDNVITEERIVPVGDRKIVASRYKGVSDVVNGNKAIDK